ncbi:MAG: hypothetical protein Q4D19_08635 [Lautropia sp.]|nr:hypothetical protein [Lautropia sp.]
MSSSKKDSPPFSWQFAKPTKVPRIIAGALDTKNSNRKLDTLARSNEMIGAQDYTLLTELVAPLATIFSPNEHTHQIVGENLETWLEGKLKELLENHQIIRRNTQLKALPPSQVLSVMIRSLYAPRATAMLCELHDRIGGPRLSDLLDSNQSAVDVVLTWADLRAGCDIVKASIPAKKKPGDSDKRKKIKSWRKGNNTPDIQGIKNFLDEVEKAGKLDKDSLFALRVWLVVARALAYCKKKAEDPIQDLMLASLHKAAPSTDEIISELNSLDSEACKRRSQAIQRYFSRMAQENLRTWKIVNQIANTMLKTLRSIYKNKWPQPQYEQTQRFQQDDEAVVAIVSADAKTQRVSIRRPRRRVAQFGFLHYARVASNDDNFETNSNTMTPVAA